MRLKPEKILRSGTIVLATAALLSAQAQPSYAQWPFGGAGKDSPAVAYCGAERAPLLDLAAQYDEIDRSRMSQSIKNGAIAAGTVLGAGLLNNLFGGRATPSGVPALNPGSAIFGTGRGDRRETATAAIVAALSTSVVTYISLKGASDDRKALARSIEEDAGGQITLGRTIGQQSRALAACRTRQIEDFKTRQAAANDADRKKMRREGDQILDAIKADIALTDKVVGRQAALAKTFTQARAMVDNRSEAQVLGAQKPAYADAASTTPLTLPPAGAGPAPQAAAPPPPPEPPPPPPVVTLVAAKATPVRETPALKGKLMMTLAARREVKAVGQAPVNGWWQIDVAGAPGYIRETTVTVKGGSSGSRSVSAPPPPKAEEPDNVREYNKVVLEARDEGPDRMRTLLTSFQ